MSTDAALRIAEQLDQVAADLADLDDQVSAGEIDEETAARLRATYLSEEERLRRLVDSGVEVASGRSLPRVVAGTVVLILGVVVIVAAAVASLGDRTPGGNLTGGVATDVITGGGVDLESVSNEEMEAVIAANPEIVPMRMALARRYFEAGEFGDALRHYLYVLDDLGRDEPEALANVGWMTTLSGRPDVGRDFVVRALDLAPDYPQAYWFLANIDDRLGDPCATVESVEILVGFEELPDEIRSQAQRLLESAEAACDG